MGLFDNTGDDSSSDEVVINAPGDSSSEENESRLKSEVETTIAGTGSTGSEDVELEDIHSQNERIIELLEKLVDEDSGSSRSSSSSHRVTDDSSSSSRVTDRSRGSSGSESSSDEGIGGGMDELL